MSVRTGLVTVEEFLRLPDPREGQYELHHGEVVLVPPPKRRHEKDQHRIQRLLRALEDRGNLHIEMAFQPTPEHEIWRADVGFIWSERDAAAHPDGYLQGAPDLVVEVRSPSNTDAEMEDKRSICIENGCSSFWLFDRSRKRLSITEDGVTREYGPGDYARCKFLDEAISVRELFED